MTLSAGMRVGPYEVHALIGAGGMGEVYRGRDNRLNRDVAIKVLPDLFASDQDRVARFEREAQSLAAVSHPAIAQVFGVLEIPHGASHTLALVMEFVEGEDLAQRIGNGPLALDDALAIAAQIAEGLAAAHDRGIVHRDLKPANVKVRPDGQVKLLDFGLAKELAPAVVDSTPGAAPTLTSPAITQMGVMLGTAAYMSPEQARGKAVDKRADVWAFGCVLYEMLTGVSPFQGESIGDVIAAVLTKEVDWQRLPPATPASVRRLLRRSLERDPKRRIRDLGDAVLELEATEAPPVAGHRHDRRSPARRSIALAAALAALCLAAAAWWLWPGEAHPAPVRAAVIPDAGFLDFSSVAISPDGSQIAHYRDREIGGGDLFLRSLDAFSERVLLENQIGLHPIFSPSGDQLAYFFIEQRAIFRIPINGGTPVLVVRAAETSPGLWLDDDSLVVAAALVDGRIERGLSRVPAAGGAPSRLTTLAPGEEFHLQPAALPGRRIVFAVQAAGRHQLALADLDNPGPHRILSFAVGASSPKYVSSGHLLYFQPAEGQVLAVPFDPARGEATGSPVVVLSNVHRGNQSAGSFDVSRDGHLFYTPQDAAEIGRRFGLTWAGPGAGTITAERAAWAQPRLSPDGRRLLVRETATPSCTLWLYDLERGSRTRIQATDPHEPVWHPDGRRVFFSSVESDGVRRVFTIDVDGTDAAVPVETTYSGTETPRSVSPDGAWLAVTRTSPKSGADLWVVPLAGGEARRFAGSDYSEDHAAFSPDGQWIAYTSNQSGRDEVYVRPWPAADEQYQVSTAGGTGAVWSGDGRRVAYADGRRVVAVNIEVNPAGAPRFRAGTPQPLTDGGVLLQRVGNYDLARDGTRLVIVEGAFTDARVKRELRVVFNWVEELKRRVPVR